MRLFVAAMIAVFVPAIAMGQSAPRLGVFVEVEHGYFGSWDSGESGLGWTVGIERLLTEKTGIEIELGQGFVGDSLKHTTVTGRVAHALRSWRVQPVAWVGGGLMHEEWIRGFRANESIRGGTRQFAIDFGLGAHVTLTQRVGIRPFVGEHIGLKQNSSYRAGLRLAVRW